MTYERGMGFAANCIGVMLLILKEKYTDREIEQMFTRKKVRAMLKALD